MTAGIARAERGCRQAGVRVQSDRRLLSLAVVAVGPRGASPRASGALAPGLARALVELEESEQRALTARIRGERLTARQVEKLAKGYKTGRGDDVSLANSPSVTSDPDRAWMRTPATIRCDASGRGQVVIDIANPQSIE